MPEQCQGHKYSVAYFRIRYEAETLLLMDYVCRVTLNQHMQPCENLEFCSMYLSYK